MRYVILGAGALGTVVGAYLAHVGKHVVLVERDEQRRDQAAGGLRVVGARTLQVTASTVVHPDDLSSDMLAGATAIVCLPAAEAAPAVAALRDRFATDTVVLALSGSLSPFAVAKAAGPGRTLFGVVNLEVRLTVAGEAEYGFHNFVWIGEQDGTHSDRLAGLQIDLAWVAPTFKTQVVKGMVWSKAAYGLEVALAALSGLPPAEVYADRGRLETAAALVRETLELAPAAGEQPVAFDFFDPNLYLSRSPGEANVTDIWMRHAWARRERYRIGIGYDFPAEAGLSWLYSPANPNAETPTLVADLQAAAALHGHSMPLLERFGTLFAQVARGERERSVSLLEGLTTRSEQMAHAG